VRRPARDGIAADRAGRLVLFANRVNVTYWGVRIGCRVAAALPWPVGYALAAVLADLVFAVWSGIRERTTENMRWVVGDRADAVARASFRNYFRYMFELLRFPSMDAAAVDRVVRVEGVEHLRVAMADGRGAIAVGFHIGNIDLGAAVLARQGYPVHVVVDRFEPPRLDELLQGFRRARGLELIPIEQAPRQALRVLRRGEVLALLIDRPTPGEGVAVEFFGGPIEIPAGAALLSLRTGAPIVACRVVRTASGRFLAEVAAPIAPGEVSGRDAGRLMQRVVAVLERWVRADPTQWYPFRRMWTREPLC